MTSISDTAVTIQTSSQSVPSTPSRFGEVALTAHSLKRQGVLSALEQRVRFARRRFGHYEVIDFVAVLLGYAISGERTLEAFYTRLSPFASPLWPSLDVTNCLLARRLSSISAVEALRELFLEDLCRRPLTKEKPRGLWDREASPLPGL